MNRRPFPCQQRGIALIESLIAVLLLAIGLLGAIGMQARASSALADAGMRAEATLAADRLVGTMALDLPNLNAYALAAGATPSATLLPWYNETTGHIQHAAITIGVTAQADSTRVDIAIAWTRKTGAAQNSHRIVAYLAPAT